MERLAILGRKYNTQVEPEFKKEGAENKFLTSLGLSVNDPPDTTFQSSTQPLSREKSTKYFESLHFIRYKIGSDPEQADKWLTLHNAIRNKLITINLGLVHRCCQLTPVGLDYDILLSSGYHSLIICVESFDPWRGFQFSTYACRSLLRNFTNIVNRKQITVCMEDYEDLAPPEDTNDANLDVYLDRLMNAWRTNAGGMSEMEYDILRKRFGLNISDKMERTEPMILGDIGKGYGLTKERIRQISKASLNKLRVVLEEDPILS